LANLNKGEFDFIETNPIVVDYERTQRIQIEWRGYLIDMQMVASGATPADNKWKLNGKQDKSQSDAKNMLTKLVSWTTKEATRDVRELDFSKPDLRVRLLEQVDGKLLTREYIGTIGEDNVWVKEQGLNWAYSISGDDIHAYVTSVGEVQNGKNTAN
jgi:hypothetical protein